MLLTTGFFVCGFHVSFITVHFPSYVQDLGLAPSVGAISISLIGAFNIIGSFGSGAFGQRWSKKRGLTVVFGVRYLATLFGVVFLSHQLGSFMGVWLGGYIYDHTGSYDPVWWAGLTLSIAAAVIHLPIDEQPLPRRRHMEARQP